MKLIISALSVLFSLNVMASDNCNLGFWDSQIEKVNETYARGEIDHHTYFTQVRSIQKMIGKNTYECIFERRTSDLTKEAIQHAKSQFPADKANAIETATNLLNYELKHGSVSGAVRAKMKL